MLDSDSCSAAGRKSTTVPTRTLLALLSWETWTARGCIRNSRFANVEWIIMVLKPQDVYVALKIVASQADRAPYSQRAAELVMSPSEVHASVRRAEVSHLLHGPQRKNRPNFSALEEF